MARDGPGRDPPVILTSRHGDGGDLTPISPFAQEGHDERLYPRGTEEEGQ